MQIALFADIHGRVELCFKLCARWQQETGLKLDRYRPLYHIYGHTGEPFYQRQDRNGITLACKLADLS